MEQDKLLRLLGLAQRAGKIKSGNFAADESVKKGACCLLLVSSDTSEASKKKARNMCAYYDTPYREYSDKEALGHAIGKEMRSVVAIEAAGFAGKILAILESTESKGGSAIDGKDQ